MKQSIFPQNVVSKPHWKTALVFSLGLLTPLLFVGASAPKVTTGTWTRIAASGGARSGACAAALADGRVFINGGAGTAGALNSSEILGLDGAISSAAPMSSARTGHTCTLLVDGRVLAAGGANDAGALSTAEIYDPGSNSWHAAGDMTNARAGHTATRLKDGRVLIAGGEGPSAVYNTIEIFDPAANTFAFHSTGLLSSARKEHAAALLPDGRVLIAGGTDGTRTLDSTDFYDPRTETLAAGPSMRTARAGATATVLWDGTVLMAGGNDLGTAEIFDPISGRFTETGKMTAARKGHLAFVLPNNNNVLLIGGDATGRSAELYIPWRGAFKPTGSLDQDRVEAVAAPMGSDGLLFLAGGRTKAGRGAVLDSTLAYRFATLKTDSESYAPGSIVTLTGSGWQPGERVVVQVHEQSNAQADSTLAATADGSGNVETQFQTAPVRDRNYSFIATGAASEVKAHSSTGASFGLGQCADGSGLTVVGERTATCSWVNGNVNAAKASYVEGDSLPYQMVATGLAGNTTYVLTIQWNTSSSAKHTLDFITGFQRTVGNADPFGTVFGGTGCPVAQTFSSTPIPVDPDLPAGSAAQLDQANILGTTGPSTATWPSGLSNGSLYLCGGTLQPLSAASYSGLIGTYSSGSAFEQLSIPFKTGAGSNITAVLTWGAHISTHIDWGAGNSAVSLSGSPFHTSLVQFTVNNGSAVSIGSQDRALALGAVVFPASITINKTISNGPATTFNFSLAANPTDSINFSPGIDTTSPAPYSFTLSGGGSASFAPSNTPTGAPGEIFPVSGSTFAAYTFSEAVPTGWQTPAISCTTTGGLSTNSIFSYSPPNVTFTPNEGDQIVCGYTNTASTNDVTLTKTVAPANDTGSFNLSISPGGASCSKTVSPSGSVSCAEVFASSVRVGETGGTGTSLSNYDSSLSCSGVGGVSGTTSGSFSMPNNAVTCTLQNTRHQYAVTLTKATVPTTDTGTFALTIAGCASGTNATATKGNTGHINCPVYGGQSVTVSEVADGNYTSSLSCTGVSGVTGTTSGSFTMPDGAVNCTLTNTRKSHSVTLTKTVLPSGDTGTFALSISDSSGTTATTGTEGNGKSISRTVTGGLSVTVSETANSNYTATSLVCTGASPSVSSDHTSGTFTMPDADVSCTITNTRNSHTVTLNKATVPTTDTGTFSLTITWTDYNNVPTSVSSDSVKSGGNISGSVTAGFTVNVSEVSNSNYTSSLSCGNGTSTTGLTLTSNTNTAGAFTMPDGDVTCTLTNTRNATLTIFKVCAPTNDTTTSFNISVSPPAPGSPTLSAATCNDTLKGTGPIPLTPDPANGTIYTVSEVTPLPAGYTQPNLTAPFTIGTTGWTAPGSIACAGSAGNTVTLHPGDTATCFILNVSSVCTPSLPSGTSTTEGQQPAPAIRPAKPRAPRHPLQKR